MLRDDTSSFPPAMSGPALENICLPVQFVNELAATQTAAEIPQIVARWFREILRADRASITLADGTVGLKLIALDGNNAIPLDMPVPIKGTMVGRIYARASAERCNDLRSSRDLDCRMLARNGILSTLGVPLFSGPQCFGTINVGRATTGAFDDIDERRLGAMAHFIGALMHIHRQADSLQKLADCDPLTDALNRRAFISHFNARRLHKDEHGSDGAALIDLDHFKTVNDRFGHEIGDRVLVHVSQLLHKVCRKGDLIARFGGEEFLIVLDNINVPAFEAFLDRLLTALRDNPLETSQGKITVTASIGATCSKRLDTDFNEIYTRVDKAMYRAKLRGRNCVVFDYANN